MMLSRMILTVLVLALVFGVGCAAEPASAKVSIDRAKLPAFPGAEGFGATTPGGRGGRVIEVTNLNDSGPGSLREACDANDPRIVVFRVAGNIMLKKRIKIATPFITIAGQFAPGDGICISGEQLVIGTHDVVIRFIRVRPGDVAGRALDAIWGRDFDNVILDHISASWSVDEGISFTSPETKGRAIVQYCISSEPLNKSVHAKGDHGYSAIFAAWWGSYHHNLLAHGNSRNPRFARCDTTDYRNNVTYNWGGNSAYGGDEGQFNLINNYYKAGPATGPGTMNRIVSPDTRPNSDLTGKWYITGNFVDGFPDVTADNWNGGVQPRRLSLDVYRADKEFPAPQVTTQSAKDAYETVLRTVGCVLPKRDSVDARIIQEVRTGTAGHGKSFRGGGKGIIDSQEDVGGWPQLKSGPLASDSDHDGMPDDWEKKHSLNPSDPSDGARDADGDGYTNIEEYLNGTDPTQFIDYTKPQNNIDVLVK